MSSAEHNVVNILGVTVDRITMQGLTDAVCAAIRTGRRVLIANVNLRAVYLNHRSAVMREFYDGADLIHADGMPLVRWAMLLGLPLRPEHRTTYVDWMDSLMRVCAESGWRVFYLGSRADVLETGAAILRARYPGLEITTRDGYFEPETSPQVVRAINDARPHVLFVGMGMPRQEQWILANRAALAVNVILPSGAAIDYVAGAIPTPPRWTGPLALEWLWRLRAEPRRLWRRYLIEPWWLLPYAGADVVAFVRRTIVQRARA